MQNILVPATQSRGDFMRVVQTLANKFGSSESQIINTYKIYNQALKMPKALSPQLSSYDFNPVKAVETPVPGEVKIDKNDFFAVTGVGLRFTRATYSSATGQLSAYGNYDEYTFPYATVFSGSGEQSALLTTVRGSLSLFVTDDMQWNIPCSELVYENQQINAQVQTIGYGGDAGHRGIYPLDSIVVMDGGADNKLTLNLLAGTITNIDGNTNATTRNLIMPVLYGFQIKNLSGGGFSAANCRI